MQLNAESMVDVQGHVAWWATADNYKGPAEESDDVHASLHFGYSDPDAVEALADAVSYPDSPDYGKFLSVAEFTARFAPPKSYVDSVVTYLESSGLHITYLATNRKYVAFEGDIATFSKVFEVSFGLYLVNGLTVRSPQSDPKLPASLVGKFSLKFNGMDQGIFLDISRPRYKKVDNAATPTTAQPDARNRRTFSLTQCIWSNATAYTADHTLGCGYRPSQVNLGTFGTFRCFALSLTQSARLVAAVLYNKYWQALFSCLKWIPVALKPNTSHAFHSMLRTMCMLHICSSETESCSWPRWSRVGALVL